MKKNILMCFVLGIFLSTSVLAQSVDKNMDQAAKQFADEACACFNKVMEGFHPEIQKLMKNMFEIGEEAATEEFTKYLLQASEEEQQSFMAEMERLSQMESLLDEQCGEMETKYEAYDDNPDFEERVMQHLEKSGNCKLLGEIMRKTKEEGASEEDDKN